MILGKLWSAFNIIYRCRQFSHLIFRFYFTHLFTHRVKNQDQQYKGPETSRILIEHRTRRELNKHGQRFKAVSIDGLQQQIIAGKTPKTKLRIPKASGKKQKNLRQQKIPPLHEANGR